MTTLTQEQKNQLHDHIKDILADYEIKPSVTHVNPAPTMPRVVVNLFYLNDDVLNQLRESGATAQIKERIAQDFASQFEFLQGQSIYVVVDSMDRVDQMGGWLGYYK